MGMRRWAYWWLFPIILGIATVRAEPVELTLPGKLVARGEFRPGDVDKPAVLLLHGFLQTHEFPTIQRLADNLAGEGYAVLTPSLSLGVPHRRQSLACEAIHTHGMADAMAEIDAWVRWLKRKKPRAIVLMGHSFGSAQTLAYLSGKPDPAVRALIGVSIMEGRVIDDRAARQRTLAELRARVKAGDRQPVTQPFSYCKAYRATPASLLSYLEWTPDRLLEAINRAPLPVAMIMGGRDDRLGAAWIERLGKTRAKLEVIEGADHFMDGEHEFDLLDRVLTELRRY
jgi:dienelactone hydrolase